MLVDDAVDLGHQADRFRQGDDDLLVVSGVVLAQCATAAVFEPFFANLIAADVEVPDGFGYAMEADGLRFIDPNRVARPRDFFDFGLAAADELGN